MGILPVDQERGRVPLIHDLERRDGLNVGLW
jgi:hypothetical protein